MRSLWEKVNTRISIEAIVSAAIIDHAITVGLSLLVLVPFLISIIHQNPRLGKLEFLAMMADYLNTSQVVGPLWIVLGSLATVIGGYFAAHIGGKSALLNGFCAGVISDFSVWIQNIGYSVDPGTSQYRNLLESIKVFDPSFTWTLFVISPFLGLLGAYLYLKLSSRGVSPRKSRFFEKLGITTIFNGRMGRWAFFASGVFLSLLYVIGFALLTFSALVVPTTIKPIVFVVGIVLLVILTLGFFVLSYSCTVRRLHDIGLNGWLGLAYNISYIGVVFSFFILLWPGTTGSNKYGEVNDKFSLTYTLTGKGRNKVTG